MCVCVCVMSFSYSSYLTCISHFGSYFYIKPKYDTYSFSVVVISFTCNFVNVNFLLLLIVVMCGVLYKQELVLCVYVAYCVLL